MAFLMMLGAYAVLLMTPAALLVWFVISLVRYCRARKTPEGPTRNMRIQLILSSVLLALVLLAFVLLIAVFAMAIAFM